MNCVSLRPKKLKNVVRSSCEKIARDSREVETGEKGVKQITDLQTAADVVDRNVTLTFLVQSLKTLNITSNLFARQIDRHLVTTLPIDILTHLGLQKFHSSSKLIFLFAFRPLQFLCHNIDDGWQCLFSGLHIKESETQATSYDIYSCAGVLADGITNLDILYPLSKS